MKKGILILNVLLLVSALLLSIVTLATWVGSAELLDVVANMNARVKDIDSLNDVSALQSMVKQFIRFSNAFPDALRDVLKIAAALAAISVTGFLANVIILVRRVR